MKFYVTFLILFVSINFLKGNFTSQNVDQEDSLLTDDSKIDSGLVSQKIKDTVIELKQPINGNEITPVTQYEDQKGNNLKIQIWNFFGLFLGFLGSIYGTIIFQRYSRFRACIRELAIARIHFEGYPVHVNHLNLKSVKAKEFFRLVERIQWQLNVDGHLQAGKKVSRLYSFAFTLSVHIEEMVKLKEKNINVDDYLNLFQIEYSKENEEFIQFEEDLKPDIWSLISLKPHPMVPKKSITENVTYFQNLP